MGHPQADSVHPQARSPFRLPVASFERGPDKRQHGRTYMAIDDLLDQHEQSERVRTWLRNNGAALIGGVLLGLAAIGGWKWWQQHEHARHVAVGQQYQAALQAIEAGDLAKAQPKVRALSDPPYASLASLQLARAQVLAGERDAAIATLRAARPADPALARVVQVRLARLLVDAGKPQEALDLLADADHAGALEARGDAQAALGQHEQARASYNRALTLLDVGAPQRRLLELKLTAVGGAPVQPGANT